MAKTEHLTELPLKVPMHPRVFPTALRTSEHAKWPRVQYTIDKSRNTRYRQRVSDTVKYTHSSIDGIEYSKIRICEPSGLRTLFWHFKPII